MNNSASHCPTVSKFDALLHYRSPEAVELSKPISDQIQNGGRRPVCTISLKFGTWLRYGCAKPTCWLQAITIGATGAAPSSGSAALSATFYSIIL